MSHGDGGGGDALRGGEPLVGEGVPGAGNSGEAGGSGATWALDGIGQVEGKAVRPPRGEPADRGIAEDRR